MFTDMGEQSVFLLYKLYYCYLMDRICEHLLETVMFCFINIII